ncbi:MAG: thiamine pyrophosphate-binding protein [Acidobacteria bacterium]|nr:thiamine pyrophosphate-binding protein [Acidobacteriota bacterium]
MRELVQQYLQRDLSRRAFVQRMVQSGFTLMAANSVLAALPPAFAREGEVKDEAPVQAFTRKFRGTGGELLAEQLLEADVEYLFLGNGTGVAPLADAVVDRPKLKIVLSVHENLPPAMADGYSKASGKTAFGMFSRVGVPNAASNMYNAMKDRSSIVLASDKADIMSQGRYGHEDIDDTLAPYKEFTKWRWNVESPARIPEWVMKAFKLSSTPPGGPTLLMFPRDVSNARDVEAEIFLRGTFNIPMNVRADAATIDRMARTLIEAKSPLLRAGPDVWRFGAVPQVVELAELLAIPVTSGEGGGFRLTCNFPTNHPLFLGGYAERMRYPRNVDVLLNMGERLPDPGSGPRQIANTVKIIDVRIEASDIGQAHPVYMGAAANVKQVAEDLVQAIKSMATADRLKQIRGDRLEQTRQYVSRVRQAREQASKVNWDKTPLSWERLSSDINEVAERDAWIVTEFGSAGPKALNAFTFAEGEKTLVGRTTGSALGWGVPASVGVKIAQPDKQVISLQADGGFLFGGQSLAMWTMVRYQIPVITVIYNNRSYNETRVRAFSGGGRQAQTGKDMLSYLGDPDVDFVKLAAAFGVPGEQVTTPNQIKPAMKRAVRAAQEGKPYLIDALVGRSGTGAESNWCPKFSVADMRTRKV